MNFNKFKLFSSKENSPGGGGGGVWVTLVCAALESMIFRRVGHKEGIDFAHCVIGPSGVQFR